MFYPANFTYLFSRAHLHKNLLIPPKNHPPYPSKLWQKMELTNPSFRTIKPPSLVHPETLFSRRDIQSQLPEVRYFGTPKYIYIYIYHKEPTNKVVGYVSWPTFGMIYLPINRCCGEGMLRGPVWNVPKHWTRKCFWNLRTNGLQQKRNVSPNVMVAWTSSTIELYHCTSNYDLSQFKVWGW